MSKPPLLVHLIFHPACARASELARTIHGALNADPAVPGLRVPWAFRPTVAVSPPGRYDLDEAENRELFRTRNVARDRAGPEGSLQPRRGRRPLGGRR